MAQTVFDLFDKKTQQPTKAIHPIRLVQEIEAAFPDLAGKIGFNTAYTKVWSEIELDPETTQAVWKVIQAHNPKGALPKHEQQQLEDLQILRAAASGKDAELLAKLAAKESFTKDDYADGMEALVRQNAVLQALVRKVLQG